MAGRCHDIGSVLGLRADNLRTIPVAIAFPSVSLSYVLLAGIDYFWFKEALGWAHLAGIALIIGGVTLLNH